MINRMRTPGRLLAALIGLAAFAVFAHTLTFGFVYDDAGQVVNNPWIWQPRFFTRLLTEGVWSFKGDQPSNYYRPVQMLLYFAEAQIFGRRPFGFHLTNVLAHAAASIAACLLLRRVTGDRRAACAALLFAVHPAHVESVAWIAGSTDVNCALLTFACLLAWSKARGAAGRRRLAPATLAGVLFFLALLAKETAIVVPLLALALPPPAPRDGRGPEDPPADSPARSAWLPWAAGVAVVSLAALLPYLLLRARALGGLWSLNRHPDLDLAGLVANALALVPRYLTVAFAPWRLLPDRVFEPAGGLLDPWCLAGAAILAVAAGAAAAARRAAPAVTFGLALLLLPLLPVLQVQLVGENVQADRYLYLPSLGACLLIAEGAARVMGRLRAPAARPAFAAACVVLGIAAAARTVTAASIWKDDETLARAAIALEPRSVIMRVLLAGVLDRAGRIDEAYRFAAEATALDPADEDAAVAVAALGARRQGKSPGEEVAALRAALEKSPGHPYLWSSLSAACLRARLFDQARVAAERALAIEPASLETIVNLASALGALGDHAGQERQARRALELDPGSALAWLSLGEALLARRDLAGYEEAIRRAAGIDPSLARARLGLSMIALRSGRRAEALREAERAAELDPGDAAIWVGLGVVREQQGDRQGARGAWERALALEPGHAIALKYLRRLGTAP
jgi:tetratricopeptide (TPR) repeat protein